MFVVSAQMLISPLVIIDPVCKVTNWLAGAIVLSGMHVVYGPLPTALTHSEKQVILLPLEVFRSVLFALRAY